MESDNKEDNDAIMGASTPGSPSRITMDVLLIKHKAWLPTVELPESINADNVDPHTFRLKQINNVWHLCAIVKSQQKWTLNMYPMKIATQEHSLQTTIGTLNDTNSNTTLSRTRMDYLEMTLDKFGTLPVFLDHLGSLVLHTTFTIFGEGVDDDSICHAAKRCIIQAKKKIHFSTEKEEKTQKKIKNKKIIIIYFFFFLEATWHVYVYREKFCIVGMVMFCKATNKKIISGETFIQKIISQMPVQIARGKDNDFCVMYNGTDDYERYSRWKENPIALCTKIRFGLRKLIHAIFILYITQIIIIIIVYVYTLYMCMYSAYDGLIKAWEGPVRIVTSMGKQSTGKSYQFYFFYTCYLYNDPFFFKKKKKEN
ncbi:hypothetical protein RFI_24798 [Reticulomyxa filosa]|uniref:Uncharacterized protein n=1 Tax=Reticulomyxa filosa TaxID=46433 RepID=X6MGN3_RETFI|nr:hypothetical protein RFI_24798 [Reticulomyxa filosa]|eukprot:ETO12577.1 hypothetical protein RFI_24798 [Reticulomyxa filosa]